MESTSFVAARTRPLPLHMHNKALNDSIQARTIYLVSF